MNRARKGSCSEPMEVVMGRSYDYKQSATYALFEVEFKLRFLKSRCVDKEAYKSLEVAEKALRNLSSEDFSEDYDGNIIRDLVPGTTPDWKR